jgi:hypothetical protein
MLHQPSIQQLTFQVSLLVSRWSRLTLWQVSEPEQYGLGWIVHVLGSRGKYTHKIQHAITVTFESITFVRQQNGGQPPVVELMEVRNGSQFQ